MSHTAANLTAWGFHDCARDANNGAFGAALPKLLMRNLPRHYPGNSVYSLFPLMTPYAMAINLAGQGVRNQYTDTEGQRPRARPEPKVVDTLQGIRHVFGDPKKYRTTYAKNMTPVTAGYDFLLASDEEGQ